MTTTIAIIIGIAIFISFVAGFVVTHEYKNMLLGILTTFGGTAMSIAAVVVFINYEPATASDKPKPDESTLDAISPLFTEAFNMLAAFAPVILIALVFGAVMQFVKNNSER